MPYLPSLQEFKENHHKEKPKVSQKLLKGCVITCDLETLCMIKARKKAVFLANAQQRIQANTLSTLDTLPPMTHLPNLQRFVQQASGSPSAL